MRLMRSLLLCMCIALTACSSSRLAGQSTPAYPDLLVSMRREPCFGTCPYYTIEVHADGTVSYEGLGSVQIEGKHSTTLNPEQIEELVKAIDDTNFFLLDDQYLEPAVDLPSVRLTIILNGQTRSIWHYGMFNCSDHYQDTQHKLCRLEAKIDELSNSSQWVKQE